MNMAGVRSATINITHVGKEGEFPISLINSRNKPIFHQNAKYLASGTFASPNAKNSTSASPNTRIPTCWYILR